MVGHDRGALVAFRLGLDFPLIVDHVGVLAVIPVVDNWKALSGVAGVFASHLYFLAQPTDLPERMIGADPDMFFGHFLDTWPQDPNAIPQDIREIYLASSRQTAAIAAVCADYRSDAFVDVVIDSADQADGCQLLMPVLAM